MEFEDEVLRRLGAIDEKMGAICKQNKKQDDRCRQIHTVSDDRLAHLETGTVNGKECEGHRKEIFKEIKSSDKWVKALLVSIVVLLLTLLGTKIGGAL